MKKIIGQILILLLILLSFGCNKENYKYKVTLDFDGGDFKTNVIYFNDGKDVRLPKPKKDNCTFIGWYEFDYVGEGNLVEKIENRNYNLTAKYTHNKEYSEYEEYVNWLQYTTHYVYEDGEYTCYYSFELWGSNDPFMHSEDYGKYNSVISLISDGSYIKDYDCGLIILGKYLTIYREFKDIKLSMFDISMKYESNPNKEAYGITKEFITLDLEEVPKEDCNALEETAIQDLSIYYVKDEHYNRYYFDIDYDLDETKEYHFDLQIFGIDGNDNIFDLIGIYNVSKKTISRRLNDRMPKLDNIELEYIVAKCIYIDDVTGETKTLYYKAPFACLLGGTL